MILQEGVDFSLLRSRSGYSLERSIAAAAEKIANAGAGLFVGNLPRRYTLTGQLTWRAGWKTHHISSFMVDFAASYVI